MAKKKQYPQVMEFRFMGFKWLINFVDIFNENYGETDLVAKEINIYYKNRTKQDIIETLLHELQHVMLFDLVEPIFHFENEKIDNKEENAIRLTSPRVFHLLRDNVKLMDFIVKEIKECN